MRVHTPTSIEQVKRYIDVSDIFNVIVAAPIALVLRDAQLICVWAQRRGCDLFLSCVRRGRLDGFRF